MAIKKIIQQRRNQSNTDWDILHAQTSADVVFYDDTQTQLNAANIQEAIEGLKGLVGTGGGSDIIIAATAPAEAEIGDLWFDTTTASLYLYFDDGTTVYWIEVGGMNGVTGITISPAPPSDANPGELWWNSTTGVLYIYYNDGDSEQWVDATFGSTTSVTANVIVSPTEPENATQGNLWWDNTDGVLYIFHESAAVSEWVPVNRAADINYDNTTSGLTATTVQAALDEIFAEAMDSGANVTISATEPVDPAEGDLWWDNTDGILYIFYNDGVASSWVKLNDAVSINYNNLDSGLTATSVQAAIDEIIAEGIGGGANVVVSPTEPADPAEGDLWWDSSSTILYIYYNDGTSAQWVQTSFKDDIVTISENEPINPLVGELWWDSVNGILFIYYDDGDSEQWVEITNGSSSGSETFDLDSPVFTGVPQAPQAPLNTNTNQIATTSFVHDEINSAQLSLGTNYAVADLTARDALTDLVVGDTVFVTNTAIVEETFVVTVVNDGTANIFVIDGVQKPTLDFVRGGVYTFDQSDATNVSHQLAFKDGADNSYTIGVVTTGTLGTSGAQTVITVANDAPDDLRYYCIAHGNYMGNTITVSNADSQWAQYKVIEITDGLGSTSTFEEIMNQTIYTNVSTKESLKATYESNPDTNAFTDNEKTKLGSFDPSDKADKLAEFVTISTNHTIGIDDAGKVLICTNSQGITITVPGDDVFEVGTQIAVFRNGTGTVSFQKINGTVKTTTNLYSKDSELNIAGQYSSAVLIKIDTNTTTNFWQLIGDLEL